jgi:hypothetical protein
MFPSRPQARAGARALGWLSIAIGAAQMLAPHRVARAAGVPERTLAVRGSGVREIATGVALLNSERPTTWMWARVAGDVLDATLLSRALRSDGRAGTKVALLAVGVLALADLVLARRLSQPAPIAPMDYKQRSGFPMDTQQMRGIARSDFAVPADMRVPPALRPWSNERAASASRSASLGDPAARSDTAA